MDLEQTEIGGKEFDWKQGKRGPVWMCGELPTVETEEPEHEES